MKTMQLRDAKAKLSQVVDDALAGEQTTITRHGTPVAVVVPIGQAMKAENKPRKTFGQHLLEFPGGIDLDALRDHTPPREIDL
jgi:prevent-host-death family protein